MLATSGYYYYYYYYYYYLLLPIIIIIIILLLLLIIIARDRTQQLCTATAFLIIPVLKLLKPFGGQKFSASMEIMGRGLDILRQFVVLLLLVRIISATRCPYCDNEFISLGRHVWRCAARVTSHGTPPLRDSPQATQRAQGPSSHNSAAAQLEITEGVSSGAADEETCMCGRKCKGRRGLRAHQRACGMLKNLLAHTQLNDGIVSPSQDSCSTSVHGAPKPFVACAERCVVISHLFSFSLFHLFSSQNHRKSRFECQTRTQIAKNKRTMGRG